MNLQGIVINNESNYYKIAAIIKNNPNITTDEIKFLSLFLEGKLSKDEIIHQHSNRSTETENVKLFSAIRGLIIKDPYSFFNIEQTQNNDF